MKIKICEKNRERINSVLKTANGRARTHVATNYNEIEYSANEAESVLSEIEIPKGKRVGAEFVAVTGDWLPKAYKYAAIRGQVRLQRGTRAWFLVGYAVDEYYEVSAKSLRGKLVLTGEQNLRAYQNFLSAYNLASQDGMENFQA